jgi:hypothetical protein
MMMVFFTAGSKYLEYNPGAELNLFFEHGNNESKRIE